MGLVEDMRKARAKLPAYAKPEVNPPTSRKSFPVIQYSPDLVLTGKNYYDSQLLVPEFYRMSTAAEELAIQLGLERAGTDPREAEVFDDLFARNDSKTYMLQWTATGLRVPNGRDPNKYETDSQGRKYFARIVLSGDNETREILVPEGNDRVVVEWDEVSGLPKTTEDIAFPHTPYTTHFLFEQEPLEDSESGHYDVAVRRGKDWRFGENGRCLEVDACYTRWAAASGTGFRPVRG